jgi:predicted PurR-regulated permease PerM
VVQLFAGVVDVVIGVLLVFVIGFYLLRDGDRLRQGARQLLPTAARPKYDFVCEALSTVVGGYIRAQLLMATIIGVLAGIGCLILGVHFAIVIGVLAFALELVPFVGALTAAVVAVLFALLQSFHLAVEVVILFIVIHIVEGYLLGPRITGKRVHLHPLAALLAMVLGIKVAGILGALFAVPLAGLVNVLVRALYYDIRAQRPEQFGSRPADRWGGWKKAWAQLRARRQESTFPRLFGPKEPTL